MNGQEIGKAKKSRAKYEVIIILLVIVVAIVVAFGIHSAQGKAEKGKLMISELEQLRSAVATYKTLNKSNPPDLLSLTKMTYSFEPGQGGTKYLTDIKTDKDGVPIDPFGNPYKYDSKTGWVGSATKRYSNW